MNRKTLINYIDEYDSAFNYALKEMEKEKASKKLIELYLTTNSEIENINNIKIKRIAIEMGMIK